MENRDLEFMQRVVENHYSVESAQSLLANRQEREKIEASMNKPTSEARRRRLQEEHVDSRKRDVEVIKEDWKNNQPEKYAFHLIKTFNKFMNSANSATTEEEKKRYLDKIDQIMEENKKWILDNEEIYTRVLETFGKEKGKDKEKSKAKETRFAGKDSVAKKPVCMGNRGRGGKL
jgi:hypothetical protein